jgi:hypothetical protein
MSGRCFSSLYELKSLLGHINVTIWINTIVAFDITVAPVIPLVTLLMLWPVMWHEEHT